MVERECYLKIMKDLDMRVCVFEGVRVMVLVADEVLVSILSRMARRVGENKLRDCKICVAVLRTLSEVIRSGRRTVVKTRKGFLRRDSSVVGRKAVPWRGKPTPGTDKS